MLFGMSPITPSATSTTRLSLIYVVFVQTMLQEALGSERDGVQIVMGLSEARVAPDKKTAYTKYLYKRMVW